MNRDPRMSQPDPHMPPPAPRDGRPRHARGRRHPLGIFFEALGVVSFGYLAFKYALVPLLVLLGGLTGGVA